jgi:N-acetylneuraminate lyase
MKTIPRIDGIHIPLVTPFDDQGNLAPDKALPLIERHLDLGVRGFYISGSSGEGFLQSISERSEYLQFVAQATKQRVTLIAQVGALSSQDAWTLSENAADYGYDIVSSTPPFYYNYSEQEIVSYYKELSQRSPLPVLIYNTPGTTGKNLSIDAQIELLRLPNVIGSKHTDVNFFGAERLIRTVEGTQIVNGPDEMLIGGLAMGMVGGIGSTYNMMPKKYLDLYRFFSNGEVEKARQIQAEVNDVIYELLKISPGVVPGIKLGLKILGYNVGEARKPFQPISGDTAKFQKLLINCNGL